MSLRSALEGKKTEELCSELLGMASTQLEEAVQPLRDALGSLHGLMLQFGSFLERAEAALGRLSLSLTALHILPDVGFVEENGEDLYGSLSPRVEASSTAMAPVLQFMPGLRDLHGASSPNQMLGLQDNGDAERVQHVVPVGDALGMKSGDAG
jgi:hypothetical protein